MFASIPSPQITAQRVADDSDRLGEIHTGKPLANIGVEIFQLLRLRPGGPAMAADIGGYDAILAH